MRNETQKTSAQIDQKLGKLVKEQAEIKRESERLASLELSIERTMMENEDKAAQLSLQRLQIQEERTLVEQLRADTLRQKSAWLDAVNKKESKLRATVAERKEELSVMEVAIRQQIADAKKKEELLYTKEDELRKLRLEQLTDFEEQKKVIVSERRWLESLRAEIDQRMGGSSTPIAQTAAPIANKAKVNKTGKPRNSSSSQSKRKMTKRSMSSNCDLPR